MAAPVAIASMGMQAVGGIIQGLGAQESANATANAYQYKAGVALLNKQINDQNAAWATQAGGTQATISGMKSAQQIGETKVLQSGSNLDVNSGSPASVRSSQTNVAQFDQNTIRWNAAKTAYGYETKAMSDTAEASMDTMAADQSRKAGTLSMVTSFLNAGGSVAGKWMQGSQAGMFSSGSGSQAVGDPTIGGLY